MGLQERVLLSLARGIDVRILAAELIDGTLLNRLPHQKASVVWSLDAQCIQWCAVSSTLGSRTMLKAATSMRR